MKDGIQTPKMLLLNLARPIKVNSVKSLNINRTVMRRRLVWQRGLRWVLIGLKGHQLTYMSYLSSDLFSWANIKLSLLKRWSNKQVCFFMTGCGSLSILADFSTVRWLFCFFCVTDCVSCAVKFNAWFLCEETGSWNNGTEPHSA